ncbi:Tachykinin-like peptides receptor 99D [Eumeta japonica]|uniref:Tachykinin-like peptides receptor 99D n=1 Tax=Eumeta variegata TaxID=151549 RepID=A0A4C2A5E1_EUMVA|nr:Tachykinin-like peptides receptor 99D [Eumeta japonica]
MMIVVVVIFAVCWLPFHIYFIVTSYNPDVTTYPHIQEIYLGIYWLAMSNSMYNPIIYCWMNTKFRRGFKQVLWCCGAFGGGGFRRHRAFGVDRSGRSLSPSRKNGTSESRGTRANHMKRRRNESSAFCSPSNFTPRKLLHGES